MPIYEYRCDACGNELEQIQRITDDPIKTCPSCGVDALRRLVSQTSFVLKGGGWYATEYGGKSAGDDTESKASGGEKKEAAAEKKETAAEKKGNGASTSTKE
jgi:putative FmdB family regulatory protein